MTDTTAQPTTKQATTRRLSDRAFAGLLILPAALFIGVIIAWPLVETVRLSFTDANLGGEEYVGFANGPVANSSQVFI